MELTILLNTITVTRLEINQVDQILAVIAGFGIKPLYMLLSLILIIITLKNKSHPVNLIRYGLISFLLGESFCAANYLLTDGTTEILEILHGTGMVGLSVFLPWGFFALLDDWVLHFSDPNSQCTLSKLCGACWKYTKAPCKLKQLFQFMAPALAVVSLMPLFAPLKPYHCIISVYNHPVNYMFSPILMNIELRLYPILAALFILSSLFFLRGDNPDLKKSQLPFFIGVGFMTFSMFRFILIYGFTGVPQWFNFWEELTELMTITGLCVFFFIYRKSLGLGKK